MRVGLKAIWVAALGGTAFLPQLAHAQIDQPGKPGQSASSSSSTPDPVAQADETIVPDAEFEAAMPKVDGDIDAPLTAMPPAGATAAPAPAGPAQLTEEDAFTPAAPEDAEIAAPLPPLSTFEATPVEITGVDDRKGVTIRYTTVLEGLDAVGLEDRFRDLSALEKGKGKAENSAMVAARAREDEHLAVRLMNSLGYYDGSAVSTIEQNPKNSGNLRATVSATPGAVYTFGSVTIHAGPTVPAGLLEKELPLKAGDPIEAERVQGAEANVSLRLPQQGYPFIKLGDRDILLDEETHSGDYTLPVDLGPRASFGGFVTTASTGATPPVNTAKRPRRNGRREKVFETDHIAVLSRFKRGELYDSRKVDDLRDALIATSLFSTVSVEPVRTGEPGPDGTEYVDLLVRQNAGKQRTIAGELGYSTGQGIKLTGSWTHRNLFPPEGALILTGVLGTQEQGATATFRKSNWKKRDRTLTFGIAANHQDFDAYEAYTGSISGRVSYDSTPIWQKKWTYYYGFELVGSNEDQYNYNIGARDRGTWLIAALPAYIGYDTSDDLLNPTRGFRIKANASPETSVRGAARPYARLMLEGDYYQPVSDSLVIAAKARAGSIPGIARNDLPPSRRFYSGGGGSVRGFGYQELGPRSPDGKPVGGRSFNEFALEARYRFGNFGIVPFVDAGQVYEGIIPTAKDIRFGAGIGGRYYTNFGPLRIDVATPIARKKGESRIALYISIGQAF